MGLLIECPECKRRNSQKEKSCKKCGFALAKFSGRVWWIEYYDHEKRLRRERIGPNKAAAEQRLREILNKRAEGRYIKKSQDAKHKFKELAQWYLDLEDVKAKKSYRRDKLSVKCISEMFGNHLLKDVTPTLIEKYRQRRLAETTRHKKTTKPATVNREIACLKTIFSKAVKNDKAERNPAQGLKMLKENNVRDRILSQEEFTRLLAKSPEHLKPFLKLGYYTAMRQGEIVNLTWGQVNLREGFIHLRPEDTKTNEGREVPLTRELVEMFKAMPRGLPGVRVFTLQDFPRGSFLRACKEAGIDNFTFHDLRHTAINNWRLRGNDYFRIMAVSGHRTMEVFKRYNKVSREELRALVGENQ
jgi:integrase